MQQKELLDLQNKIHGEADSVFTDLNLSRLAYIGEMVSVGSYALRLMVKRDFDITVVCRSLSDSLAAIAQLGENLISEPTVNSITLRKNIGQWNTEAEKYPDGIYLQISCFSAAGNQWNFDIWFVDQPDRQPDLEHIISLPHKISFEIRLIILALKNYFHAGDLGSSAPQSYEIYSAVLDDDIDTVEGLQEWLAARTTQN